MWKVRTRNADKRKAVLTLLNDEEWNQLSNRELGKIANVSHQYIFNIRKEIKAKELELKEKQSTPLNAVCDPIPVEDKYVKIESSLLPSDIRSKNKKQKTYTIEVNKDTVDRVCKRLQEDENIATAEGLINELIQENEDQCNMIDDLIKRVSNLESKLENNERKMLNLKSKLEHRK